MDMYGRVKPYSRLFHSNSSFTIEPSYPQRKSPWYPLDGRLGVPQNETIGKHDRLIKHSVFLFSVNFESVGYF